MKIKVPKGATPLDDEILQMLIPNLTTQGELNEFEEQNIASAVLWASKSRILKKSLRSATGIKLLHEKMFNETWEWAGEFRWKTTNIGVEPSKIQNDLGILLGDVKYWIEKDTYPFDEIAIRFHHRLVWIHPFPNGNGRASRLAADLLLNYNGREKFSWGSQNLVKESKTRDKYLKALRTADKQSDYVPLLEFAKS